MARKDDAVVEHSSLIDTGIIDSSKSRKATKKVQRKYLFCIFLNIALSLTLSLPFL
jgi:hypothetical protein